MSNYFIDSTRQIAGNIVRCSKCFAYLELEDLETCPNCHNLICLKCGHCKCELSKGREIATQLKKDIWPGEHLV